MQNIFFCIIHIVEIMQALWEVPNLNLFMKWVWLSNKNWVHIFSTNQVWGSSKVQSWGSPLVFLSGFDKSLCIYINKFGLFNCLQFILVLLTHHCRFFQKCFSKPDWLFFYFMHRWRILDFYNYEKHIFSMMRKNIMELVLESKIAIRRATLAKSRWVVTWYN